MSHADSEQELISTPGREPSCSGSDRAPQRAEARVSRRKANRMHAAAIRRIDKSIFVDVGRRYLEMETALMAIHRRDGSAAAPVEARNAAVSAGIAFACAGEPQERVFAPWRLAAQRLREHFEWQHRRAGAIAPGYFDLDVLAAAHLSGSAGPLLQMLAETPLVERDHLPPRYRFFARLVAGGLAPPTVVPSEAEARDLARYTDLHALAEMLEASRLGAGAELLMPRVKKWLRVAWLRADRRAAATTHLYPGPTAPLACVLLAGLPATPSLPSELACYVDTRVIEWARQSRARAGT